MRVKFLTTTVPLALLFCRSLRKKSQKSGVSRRSFCLDACGQKRILIINVEIIGSISWYYVFLIDRKSRDMNRFSGIENFDLETIWSSSSIYKWLDLLGESKLCNLRNLSLNSSYVVLSSCHASFSPFHQMEKGKGKKEDGGWVPVVRECDDATCQSLWGACHNISAFVTGLRCHRRLLGSTLWLKPMTWFCIAWFLGGEDHSRGSDPSFISGA